MRAPAPPHGAAAPIARRRLRIAGPFARAVAAIAVPAAIAVLATACAPGGPSAPAPSVGASAPAQAVDGTGLPGSPGPKPTIWPTSTVEASIALGAAHGEFTKMTDDAAAAIDSQDPARILAAMNDSLEFLSGNQQNIPRLQAYDATKSVGDRLAGVYAKMIDGATKVRDGLTSGDADAIQLGFKAFFEGATEYAAVAPDLTAIAERAVFMKRQLLR